MPSRVEVRIHTDDTRPESHWRSKQDKLRDLDYFQNAVCHFLTRAHGEAIGYAPQAESPAEASDGMVVIFSVHSELSAAKWDEAVHHSARDLCLTATILPAAE
jgi:hypothetical protein